MADRFGTRRVFASAVALFILASMLCGVSSGVSTRVGARVLQGAAAGMMVPVGRLMVVRTFAKAELLAAMNFDRLAITGAIQQADLDELILISAS